MAKPFVNVNALVAVACFALCAIVVLAACKQLAAAGIAAGAVAYVWPIIHTAVKSESAKTPEAKRDKKRGKDKK